MGIDVGWIRERVREGRLVVSFTHTEKIRRRRIGIEDIEHVLGRGAIIEDYPEDPRGPSCLVLGQTWDERSIHVVCGKTPDDLLLIITAYEPDPAEWEPDFRTRK